MSNKSIQFELWSECDVGCDFCFLGPSQKTPVNKKIELLDSVFNLIQDNNLIKDYDTVGFIGGEFWQGQLNTPEIKKKFYLILSILSQKLISKELDSIWLSASLIRAKQDLWEVLDNYFKTIIPITSTGGLWIATSYDFVGRFHKKIYLDNWKNNIFKLHNEYSNIRLNTTMVLTQHLIDYYLNNKFSFFEFSKNYNTEIFCKPPVPSRFRESPLLNFFPRRDDFLKFLNKVIKTEDKFYDKLCNIKYRADTLYTHRQYNISQPKDGIKIVHRLKNEKNEIKDDESLVCGHHIAYGAYGDSSRCMLCDILSLI